MSVELHKVAKFFEKDLKTKIAKQDFFHEHKTNLLQSAAGAYSLFGNVVKAVVEEAAAYDANAPAAAPLIARGRILPHVPRVVLGAGVPATNYEKFCDDCATVCSTDGFERNIYNIPVERLTNAINRSAIAAMTNSAGVGANYYSAVASGIFAAAQALGINGGNQALILRVLGGNGAHGSNTTQDGGINALLGPHLAESARLGRIGGGFAVRAPITVANFDAYLIAGDALIAGVPAARNGAVRLQLFTSACAIASVPNDIVIDGVTLTFIDQVNLLISIIGYPGPTVGTVLATNDAVHPNTADGIRAGIVAGLVNVTLLAAGANVNLPNDYAFFKSNGMSRIINNFYRRITQDHGATLNGGGANAPYNGNVDWEAGTRIQMCNPADVLFFANATMAVAGNVAKIGAPAPVGGAYSHANTNIGIYCKHFIKFVIGYYFNNFLLGDILAMIDSLPNNATEFECLIHLADCMQEYFKKFTQYVVPAIKDYRVTEAEARMADAAMIASVFVGAGVAGPSRACTSAPNGIPTILTTVRPSATNIGIDSTNGDITILGNGNSFKIPGKYYVAARAPVAPFHPGKEYYQHNFHLDEHDPMVMAIDTISVYIPLTVNVITKGSFELLKTPNHKCVFFKTPLPHITNRGTSLANPSVDQINADGTSPQIIETPIETGNGKYSLAIVMMFSATETAMENQRALYASTSSGLSNKYLKYTLEDDGSITIFTTDPNHPKVKNGVGYQLENFHQARRETVVDNKEDIWNETCKAFFGVGSTAYDKWCGPMLFHVFHKTGLNMLQHITDSVKYSGYTDVIGQMKKANASIHYEILKTLDWIGERKTDGSVQMADVDTWLADLTKADATKGASFNTYFGSNKAVKDLLNEMVKSVNKDPDMLAEKHGKKNSSSNTVNPPAITMTPLNPNQLALLNNRSKINLNAPVFGRNPSFGGIVYRQFGGNNVQNRSATVYFKNSLDEIQKELQKYNQILSADTIRQFNKKMEKYEIQEKELIKMEILIKEYTQNIRNLSAQGKGFTNNGVSLDDIEKLNKQYEKLAENQSTTSIKLETAFGTIYATLEQSKQSNVNSNDTNYVRM